MITFFIPFYNEEKKSKKNLKLFLSDLKKFIKHPSNKNNYFFFYNDGSVDNTEFYLKKLTDLFKSNKVLLINNSQNKGVGHSFKKAVRKCKTKFIFFLPGDNDLNIKKDLVNLNKFFRWDLTFFCPINYEKYSTARYFLSMAFRMIYGITFGVKVNYIQSPCLYNVKHLKRPVCPIGSFIFFSHHISAGFLCIGCSCLCANSSSSFAQRLSLSSRVSSTTNSSQ